MRAGAACAVLLACASGEGRDPSADACPSGPPALSADASRHALKTVFLIVLENEDWSSIEGNPSAPYINSVLLPKYAHAANHDNGGLHPSLGNYLALEAGSALGVDSDALPADFPLPVSCHLTSYLEQVGVSWKAYQEAIRGDACPTTDAYPYTPRHNPFVYFEDVSGSPPGPGSQRCIEHVRPYRELAADLQTGNLARYNFITPDLCHSGHDACAPSYDRIRQGDDWLSRTVPAIVASPAFREAVIFITWDEPASADHRIGLIAVSPLAKPGHAGTVPTSHQSTLRTIEEIFGLSPLLRDASSATNLADLFAAYP